MLLGWRPLLLVAIEATRVEAIATRVEAITTSSYNATRVEAIATS